MLLVQESTRSYSFAGKHINVSAGFILGSIVLPTVLLASNGEIPYRALNEGDFQGQAPPRNDPSRQGPENIRIDAVSHVGTSSRYEWRVTTDQQGNRQVTVTAAHYESFFDRSGSWMDTDPNNRQNLRVHEQGHFDAAERRAQESNAHANQIRNEMGNSLANSAQERNAFLALEDQNANLSNQRTQLQNQLQNETDPARRQELQTRINAITQQIDQNTNQQVGILERNSATLNRISQAANQRDRDYDNQTLHGTRRDQQRQWENILRQDARTWQHEAQHARSLSNSVAFEAGTGQLKIRNDVITGVTGVAYDGIEGCQLIFPDYMLSGRTSWGDPIFTAIDQDLLQLEDTQGRIFLTAKLSYLIYYEGFNEMLGLLPETDITIDGAESSEYLDKLTDVLTSNEPSIFTIRLWPDIDFSDATNDFIRDASSPFSNGAGASSPTIPEPSTFALMAAGGVLLGVRAFRKLREGRS